MFDNNFDPYDLLMQIIERQQRLEQAHNKLAQSYEYTQRDLSTALHTIQDLQRRHITALRRLDALEGERINAQFNTNTNNTTQG